MERNNENRGFNQNRTNYNAPQAQSLNVEATPEKENMVQTVGKNIDKVLHTTGGKIVVGTLAAYGAFKGGQFVYKKALVPAYNKGIKPAFSWVKGLFTKKEQTKVEEPAPQE